ncbi:18625_t:CDS:2 [Rhizophagus irregularis]|nr:18625_t:CDS:2 [Rhizophagus irregularis]
MDHGITKEILTKNKININNTESMGVTSMSGKPLYINFVRHAQGEMTNGKAVLQFLGPFDKNLNRPQQYCDDGIK